MEQQPLIVKPITDDGDIVNEKRNMEQQQAEFTYLRVDALRDSPTNPRNPNEPLDPEFIESIRQNKVIQPLIVRPITDDGDIAYEIAAGHRRKRGVIAAGLPIEEGVPCLIRQLTDDQMIDFHVQENIHRKDLGPMEEAKVYNLMKDRGVPLSEIAVRAGKSESYIARRLKLVDLTPDLQADLIAGYLPLTHAFALCKYSAEAQTDATGQLYGGKWIIEGAYPDYTWDEDAGALLDPEGEEVHEDTEIYKTVIDAWNNAENQERVWQPDKTDLQYTVNRLENFLINQFTLRLDTALFDLTDKRLRKDKLTCPECPARTGANATLFDLADESPDFCLDRTCYNAKTDKFVQLTRATIAKQQGVAVEQIPVIHNAWGSAPEGYLPRNGVEFLDFNPEEGEEPDEHCESEQLAIHQGKPVTVCLVTSGCAIHHYQNRPENKRTSVYTAPLSPEEEIAKQTQAKSKRKEELWNVKVGEETRLRVITEAATKFTEGTALIYEKEVSQLTSIMAFTAARLWQTTDYNDTKVLHRFTEKAGIELAKTDYQSDYESLVTALSDEDIRKLFYLLTHYWKGDMRNNNFTDQTKVRELAHRHGINYVLVDAQVRVDLSAKKHEKKHKAYLQQVEAKDPKATVPLLV